MGAVNPTMLKQWPSHYFVKITSVFSGILLWCPLCLSSPPGSGTTYQRLHHSINRQVANMFTKNDANLALSPPISLYFY
ncbi:UNVERIFIED_CONTAM: hypothetical protein NCL1_42749 [Trichonephila clavipes]